MVSGFVASILGKEIAGKIVVVAKVQHLQRMNDPLANNWIIAEKDSTIISVAQLPPEDDKPLYHSKPSNQIGEQGFEVYRSFDKVVKQIINQRVQGKDPQ
mgnify:CR=1 FL=1